MAILSGLSGLGKKIMNQIIGVDFDNTIVSYDDLIHRIAVKKRLIPPDTLKSKKQVRDCIRRLNEGEVKWQQIQAAIYGPLMHEAQLINGVNEFFQTCGTRNIPIFIVSHKTEFANYDSTGTNLRSTALKWMEKNGFLLPAKFGLNQEHVFFQSTRQDKVERIRNLDCTHFIDDLEETFLEESFPEKVEKILFDPHGQYSPRPGVKICSSWQEIKKVLLREEA